MATDNVNMEIESKSTSTVPEQNENGGGTGNIRLTSEMLSKVQVSVNMKFLADIRNVFEVATQRGTWKANELSSVGTLVDSLDNAFKQLATKSEEVVTAVNESGDASTSAPEEVSVESGGN